MAGGEAAGALDSAPVYDPGAPCTIAIDLATPDHTARYTQRTGVSITGARSVESAGATWWEAWRQLYL